MRGEMFQVRGFPHLLWENRGEPFYDTWNMNKNTTVSSCMSIPCHCRIDDENKLSGIHGEKVHVSPPVGKPAYFTTVSVIVTVTRFAFRFHIPFNTVNCKDRKANTCTKIQKQSLAGKGSAIRTSGTIPLSFLSGCSKIP